MITLWSSHFDITATYVLRLLVTPPLNSYFFITATSLWYIGDHYREVPLYWVTGWPHLSLNLPWLPISLHKQSPFSLHNHSAAIGDVRRAMRQATDNIYLRWQSSTSDTPCGHWCDYSSETCTSKVSYISTKISAELRPQGYLQSSGRSSADILGRFN